MSRAPRPPFPRWAVVWDSTEWPTTGSSTLAPFAYQRDDGSDMAAIRAADAGLRLWREAATAWLEAAGYVHADWLAARDCAQGTTPHTCAAVAILDDGRAVALPDTVAHPDHVADPSRGWDRTLSQIPPGPRPRSNSDPVTPETKAALGGAT